MSISSPGVHLGQDAQARELARRVNEVGAELVERHRPRFGLFAALPLPDIPGAVEEAVYALDVLHADGVVLETNAAGLYPGEPEIEALFAELERRNAVVFLHPTSPPCWEMTSQGRPRPMLEFMFETTRAIVDLILTGMLGRHPHVTLIVPHGGATLPLVADRIESFRALFGSGPARTPVHEALRRLYYDVAGTPFPRQIPALLNLVGPEQLLYGSDYCWTSCNGVKQQIEGILAAPPPQPGRTWPDITTANAQRVFRNLSVGTR